MHTVIFQIFFIYLIISSASCMEQSNRASILLGEENHSGADLLVAAEIKNLPDFSKNGSSYGIDNENFLPDYSLVVATMNPAQVEALKKDESATVLRVAQINDRNIAANIKSGNALADSFEYGIDDNGNYSSKSPWAAPRYFQSKSQRHKVPECNISLDDTQFGRNAQITGRAIPDSGYKDNAEVNKEIDRLVSNYPHLVKKFPLSFYSDPVLIAKITQRFLKLPQPFTVGEKTLKGNSHSAVLVTNNAFRGLDSAKPNVVFVGLTHARELMSIEVALDIINELATGFDTKPEVKEWLEKTNVWVIPVFNPDGLDMVWSGERLWRKNGNGVDLGRNFPYEWNSCQGSSASKDNMLYHGPTAASEIETRNMMAFLEATKPLAMMSLHSYGEVVLTAPGCRGNHAKNRDFYMGLAKEIADLMPRDCSDDYYRFGELYNEFYNTDGELISYANHAHNTAAYIVEVSDPFILFFPQYSRWRDSTVKKLRGAWKHLINRVWSSALYGRVNLGSKDSDLVRMIVRSNSLESRANTGSSIYSIKPNGNFHILLDPGNYRVTLEYGNTSVEAARDLEIGESATRKDFEFR